MSFNLGGIGKGVTAGLAYDVQFMRSFAWAAKTGNQAAIADLVHIAETNVHEIVGTAVDVSESHAMSLLFANDPFKGSRELLHAFESKYGKK